MYSNFEKKLALIVEKEQIKREEPLSKHTTFKIGGNADYLVMPEQKEQLAEVLKLCKTEQIPYYVIGNGSNLLVGDKGYRGVILKICGTLKEIQMQEQADGTVKIRAGAGILLSKLAMEVARYGLTGFEFAAGIPGTLGGAVTMNAGAYGGEIKDCIAEVTVIDQDGQIKVLSNEELQLGYRMSILQKEAYIAVEAVFVFPKGNKEEILEKIAQLNQQRREKQPLEYPSAGSTFKRPKNHFAGKLIMDAGLRGYRVGDVMVSEKHCGFVVNVGNGTAEQVRKLIKEVDQRVFEKYNIHLEAEVRFVGEF